MLFLSLQSSPVPILLLLISDPATGDKGRAGRHQTSPGTGQDHCHLTPLSSLFSPQTDITVGLQSNNPHQRDQAKLDLWFGLNPRYVERDKHKFIFYLCLT